MRGQRLVRWPNRDYCVLRCASALTNVTAEIWCDVRAKSLRKELCLGLLVCYSPLARLCFCTGLWLPTSLYTHDSCSVVFNRDRCDDLGRPPLEPKSYIAVKHTAALQQHSSLQHADAIDATTTYPCLRARWHDGSAAHRHLPQLAVGCPAAATAHVCFTDGL